MCIRDRSVIARGTPGFSGADLKNLVNEAALGAARHNKTALTLADFEWARDKVMMGPERRSMLMTDRERRPRLTMKQDMLWFRHFCQNRIRFIK